MILDGVFSCVLYYPCNENSELIEDDEDTEKEESHTVNVELSFHGKDSYIKASECLDKIQELFGSNIIHDDFH